MAGDRDVGAADAFVFFGATGDLAHKMIFPALYQMVRRGTLGVPVVGVAGAGWDLPRLRDYARDSIAQAVDGDALGRLLSLMEYVDGDYGDPGTFKALRRVLGGARRPVHYLAIPPSLFATVIEGLRGEGLASGARVVGCFPQGPGTLDGAGQRPPGIHRSTRRGRHLTARLSASLTVTVSSPGLRQSLHASAVSDQVMVPIPAPQRAKSGPPRASCRHRGTER